MVETFTNENLVLEIKSSANSTLSTTAGSGNAAENQTARTCEVLFSFQVKDLNCRVAKTFEMSSYESGSFGCAYVHPYLEVNVNRRYHSTFLAQLAHAPDEYSFEDISIPTSISIQNIRVRIGSYFNTTFDILTNLDEERELNRGGAKTINAVLFDWTEVFPSSIGPNKVPGAISCAPMPAATPPAADKNKTRCSTSVYKYTPGFWDSKAGAFLPAGCDYLPRPGPGKHDSPRGRVWVHLLGDSNMRKMHMHACGRIGSRKTHTITIKPPQGETHSDHVCVSADGMVALAYTVSWMHANGSSTHYGSSRALIGQPLALLLCPALKSPGCKEAWNFTANRTLALVGSHFPQQIIPHAPAETRVWLAAIAERLPREPGTLAVALTSAVCIRHFKSVPQFWDQLIRRNNYRLRAVNDATLAAARAEGAAVVDTYSVSLAAGCDAASSDLVHFQQPVYAEHAKVVFSMLADLI
jgi:hypothetical protein